MAKIRLTRLGLALLCPLILWLAWPPFTWNFLAFFGFIPFLALEEHIEKGPKPSPYKFLLWAYLCLSLWNLFTTWWIYYASLPGAIMAILLNALLMTIPVYLFTRVKRFAGRRIGYVALVCFWLSFEYLHFTWDAPWPWLTLGNVWAGSRNWVQWYEFTGTAGGTLWIWIVNILLYEGVVNFTEIFPRRIENKQKQSAIIFSTAIATIILPVLISLAVKPAPYPVSNQNVVVVQPNIDPYLEKFDARTYASQISTLISLSEKEIDSNTVLLVWPETAIAEDIDEQNLNFFPSIRKVETFLADHPKIKLVTGINSSTTYALNAEHTATAREFPDHSAYYDLFNTALELDGHGNYTIYHKSKLVPGVEKMPYPHLLGFLGKYAIELNGPSGSLGSQDSATVFHINSQVNAAPIICYESVFGRWVGDFVDDGANVITVITNDGWWHNSSGYKQHLLYGALRAIESRRFIARSANTGVSCFVTPDGEIRQATSFWVQAVIKSPLVLNNSLTFYVKYGDYVYETGAMMAALFILALIFKRFVTHASVAKKS